MVIRLEPTDTDPRTAEIAQWTDRDQIGQGAILSALSNTLFDVYCSDSYTAKSLWDELDRKYNTEEQGLKKYYVFKFMLYQMVEDKSVAEQTHEIINLEHALANAEMKLSEKFLVMSTVDKFSKSWENFGMTLKHQKEKLSLQGTKNKKSKANKPCWNCGQVEHWAKLCPNKRAKTGHATVNMVMGGSSGASTSGAIEGVPLEHNTCSPFELWKGRKSSLKYFRVWGCLAKVLVLEHKRKTLGPKTVDVVFLGYVEISYALKFLVIKSDIPGIEVNAIVEFHDVVFPKYVFPMKPEIPSSVSLNDSLVSTSTPEHVER
ncbi:UNVERIFIED_CONTAM: hypothetical protein Scaly_1912200 [Sesamum calycinum]|uniref:CCHC-type domain-containing protein n=1 Tax=Sesamum calycinum TaxID=2727403 RepID=A0AAW2NGB7_9LAMI